MDKDGSCQDSAKLDAPVSVELSDGSRAIIDASDWPLVAGRKWRPYKSGSRKVTYAASGRAALMHRIIMGAKPGELVDHIDGDGLNNRRRNLRFSTPAQNVQRSARSEWLGVCRSRNGRFRAAIRIDGIRYTIGTFRKLEEAMTAYDAAALDVHGEHAAINQPERRVEILACLEAERLANG